jgi:hypothetical protein
VTGTVTVSATATDNKKVAKVTLLIDGREVAVSYGSSVSYSWNTTGTKGNGRKKTSSGTTSTVTSRAEDPAGNVGTASISVRKQ